MSTTSSVGAGASSSGGARQSELSVGFTPHADLLLVELEGELDAYTVPTLRERLDGFDPAEGQLVLDLCGVRLVDSAGLSALVSLRNRAQSGGRRLGLLQRGRYLGRLLQITGLRAAFALGEDLATVRAALDGNASLPARTADARRELHR